MLQIGICDDLLKEREQLKTSLTRKFPRANIAEYTSGEALLAGRAQGQHFDLLFLDICMDGINGIEAAAEIRKQYPKTPIIFLTTSPEFAVASYRVQAQDYLLKPVDETELFQSIDRQLRHISQAESRILFHSICGEVPVHITEIIYIEAAARRLKLTKTDGTALESMSTIQSIESELQAYPQFMRPHRSYIINLQQVKRMEKDGFYMKNDVFVPIARTHMTDMKRHYVNQILD